MKRNIFFLALYFALAFFAFDSLAAGSQVEFDLLINQNGTVSLLNARTFLAEPSFLPSEVSDYSLSLLGEDRQALRRAPLLTYFFLSDPFLKLNETLVSFGLPYTSKYKKLEVYHQEKLLYERDLSFLCLEDGLCQDAENFASCPRDCPSGSGDGLCDRVDDNNCDPDCLSDSDMDCREFKSGLRLAVSIFSFSAGLASLIFFLLAAYRFLHYRNAEEGKKLKKKMVLILAIFLTVIIISKLVLLVFA